MVIYQNFHVFSRDVIHFTIPLTEYIYNGCRRKMRIFQYFKNIYANLQSFKIVFYDMISHSILYKTVLHS